MKSTNSVEKFFQMRPLKAAKVSEISEATSASPIPEDERVNFHIGHPVQDKQLTQLYFKLATGLDFSGDQIKSDTFETILDQSNWGKEHHTFLKFFYSTIESASPYMPRGGYVSQNPTGLVLHLQDWLINKQHDPIEYDNGQESGHKEIMIGSGGRWETLRVLLHALSRFMIHLPLKIHTYGFDIPAHLKNFDGLQFLDLPMDEETAIEYLDYAFKINPDAPILLLLGSITSDTARRRLRTIGLEKPIFFLEVNNSPNHLSLAREAKMANRVLRILTPEIFDVGMSELSTTFVLGSDEFINILETVHFELKGTPSAPEAALLTFLLDRNKKVNEKTSKGELKYFEELSVSQEALQSATEHSQLVSDRVAAILTEKTKIISNNVDTYAKHQNIIDQKLQSFSLLNFSAQDEFSNLDSPEFVDLFFENLHLSRWENKLKQNFLAAFVYHHPEYKINRCMAISGSARTALSLLGFHCGIEEIITTDLSWTYEHCFPKVHTVPLSEKLELDDQALINSVTNKIEKQDGWKKRSAVIINNPHNASGRIFDESKIKKLLTWLLSNHIRVIDDLSYQNVGPENNFKQVKTLRQLVNEQVKNGYLTEKESQNLIVVHSLSKTDSFAGGRLAVIEISDPDLYKIFNKMAETVSSNHMALLCAYLFYRNYSEEVGGYWQLRNSIFQERMSAIEEACKNLPAERNPFQIEIRRPAGSMYPQMIIHGLPNGVSLDWLASGLANQGIGLIPLSTFARTAEGYELARKTFRLTLGGTAGPEKLYRQTRRVLIDLNRLIAQEASKYNRQSFKDKNKKRSITSGNFRNTFQQWNRLSNQIRAISQKRFSDQIKKFGTEINDKEMKNLFLKEFLPNRLSVLEKRLNDNIELTEQLLSLNEETLRAHLGSILQKEFYKEDLEQRRTKFRKRLFDRTVHPTQVYSLEVDKIGDGLIQDLVHKNDIKPESIRKLSFALSEEFLGHNVPISSIQEADELIGDLNMCIEAEEFARWNSNIDVPVFLSFWGDWDGSTRPSGQGHRLVAAVVMENVNNLAEIILKLNKVDSTISIPSEILHEIEHFPRQRRRFWKLLNDITILTNQLEKRYRSVLPFAMKASSFRRMAMRLHMAQDPLTVLWQHNDRLERKMLELRAQRRQMLEYYFSLNKKLRKTLYEILPAILKNINHPEILLTAGMYRSKLQRFVLTPRIHQKLITSDDPFAIDTTVHNITEINEIAGKFGNPGMILGLQVSMSTDPGALISLDRKLKAKKEEAIRDNPNALIPDVWSIPLFEDQEAIQNLEKYLNQIWDYATRSRRIDQDTSERFLDMICEIFIAGSDLSQQVSQAAGSALYNEAKHRSIRWLAERGLIEQTRMKLGSGEPMQRQGGYYNSLSGRPAFLSSKDTENRLSKYLKASSQKSTEYARSPLLGLLSSGDLRTFQSNISERLRFVGGEERAQIFYHIQQLQAYHDGELIRASEPLLNTRLAFKERGLVELERLTRGNPDPQYDKFIDLVTKNFRQILYGSEEDVVGIHVISYFISRSTPALRDRPSIRPSREIGQQAGQKVIERIAQTLPLSKHGSLLRAIGHNRSQSLILGINQLTTGLFRAFSEMLNTQPITGDVILMLSERILPRLPVFEILNTLRLYHDPDLKYLSELEKLFPAGNSSFLVLREDVDAYNKFIGLLQKELLRRHGLDINDFFDNNRLNPQLLPTLRPDLSVLLQEDLFNTSLEKFTNGIEGKIDTEWKKDIETLLQLPHKIRDWREKIWVLIRNPIKEQVESFVKLAVAINSVTVGKGQHELPFASASTNVDRLGTNVKDGLRGVVDDSMRQFLLATVQYLTQLPKMTADVPINIIRALKDVQRIAQIESQALSKQEQDLFRFYILQMARIAGENG